MKLNLSFFVLLLFMSPACAILWSDPAGDAQGWYNLPDDFNVQPLAAADVNDGIFFNHTGVAEPGGQTLKGLDFPGGTETNYVKGYVWKSGFTQGIYTLGFTQIKQGAAHQYNNNMSVAVKDVNEVWNYYVIGGTGLSSYVNSTDEPMLTTPGTNGLGIPAYVNNTGILEMVIFGNGTAPAVGNHVYVGALNATNFTLVSGNPIGLSIDNPTNTSFFNKSSYLNFYYSSGTNASGAHCSFYNDTAEFVYGNVANNSYNTGVYDVDFGTHNFTVICDDGALVKIDTVHFSYSIIGVHNHSSHAFAFETAKKQFNMSIGFDESVGDLSATFFLNGSGFDAGRVNVSISLYDTALFSNFSDVPLITENNTNHSFVWQIDFNYTNGTAGTFNTTSYGLPTWLAYFPTNFSAPVGAVEGEPLFLPTYFTEYYGKAVVEVNTTVSSSVYETTKNEFYYSWVNAPVISGGLFNKTIRSNSTMFVSFNDVSYSRFSTNNDTLVYKPSLVTCGGLSTAVAINFTFLDEENKTAQRVDMDATFWVWDLTRTHNNTNSFNFTNVSYAEVCLYPNNTNVVVDSFQYYDSEYISSTDYYPRRAFFLDNASISNKTQNVSLYSELASWVKLTRIEVSDVNLQPLSDAFVSFMRYDAANDSYFTVAMLKTDSKGMANTYLRPNDIWYRIIIVKDHAVQQTFDPRTIACGSSSDTCFVDLTLAPSWFNEYFQYYDKVAFSCTNSSSHIRCTITDTSGLMKYSRMRVWEVGAYTPITICDTNSSSSSAVLACNLGNTSDRVFGYNLFAHFDEETMLDSGEVVFANFQSDFADQAYAPIFAGLLVLAFAAVGAYHPVAGIFLSLVGLIFVVALQLIYLSVPVLMGLIISGIVLIYKYRDGILWN